MTKPPAPEPQTPAQPAIPDAALTTIAHLQGRIADLHAACEQKQEIIDGATPTRLAYQELTRQLEVDLATAEADLQRLSTAHETLRARIKGYEEESTRLLTEKVEDGKELNRLQAAHDQLQVHERTVKSLSVMLGWENVPPQRTLEMEVSALKALALKANEAEKSRETEQRQAFDQGHATQKILIDGKWMLFRDGKLFATLDEAYQQRQPQEDGQ